MNLTQVKFEVTVNTIGAHPETEQRNKVKIQHDGIEGLDVLKVFML